MKKTLLFPTLLLGSLALTLSPAIAWAAGFNVELVATFDYPDRDIIFTEPLGINEAGDIVGYTTDKADVRRGFVRYADGSFSELIVEPNDEDDYTLASGITDDGLICGYYKDATGMAHGYFLSDGTFTEFDVEGATQTRILGINDAGDFTGTAYIGSSLFPFVDVGGVIQTIHIRAPHNSGYIFPGGINNLDQFVGWYYGPNFLPAFGFVGEAGDKITDKILAPNATQTYFDGLNDDGLVVGTASIVNDGSGLGLVAKLPNAYAFYRYPRAITTTFTGINNSGMICGEYKDGLPHIHGIIAQVTTDSGE